LRGDGAGETLQPLFKEPIAATTYQDKSVTTGATYSYAVVAVDRSGNQSPPSERQQVVVRE
jgi:chitodextrinase